MYTVPNMCTLCILYHASDLPLKRKTIKISLRRNIKIWWNEQKQWSGEQSLICVNEKFNLLILFQFQCWNSSNSENPKVQIYRINNFDNLDLLEKNPKQHWKILNQHINIYNPPKHPPDNNLVSKRVVCLVNYMSPDMFGKKKFENKV
jgi:hypothetical protein